MLSIGIDASTQSCSAVVVDLDSFTVCAEASVNFGTDLPKYGAPQGFISGGAQGEVHSNPMMWLDALDLLFAQLAEAVDLGETAAISGAGQQHGSVYLGPSWTDALSHLGASQTLAEQLSPCLSRTTSPIWMDTSTSEECREIAAQFPDSSSIVELCGSQIIERFTGPQIRRFFKTEPTAYQSTARIHLVSSFLASVLIGQEAPIDLGDGAGMNLINLATGNWDPQLLDATAPGLAEKLPPVLPSQTGIGRVSPYFAERYGVSPQAQVVAFTGDNPSSLVGMGTSQAGRCVISLGTSDTLFAALPGSVFDTEGSGHVFGNPSGGTMALQCFMNGSLAREKIKEHHGLDWEGFSAALEQTPPGNQGKLMLPFFGPEISPRRDDAAPTRAGGDAAFIAGQQSAADIRACVEGQFLNMYLQSQWMGLSPETLYLTGGAAQNDAIAQVVADVFQARVERIAVSGSVALGGAMRAAMALGHPLETLEANLCRSHSAATVNPNTAAHAVYAEQLGHFKTLLGQNTVN